MGVVSQRHDASSIRTEIVPHSCVEDEARPPGIGVQEHVPNQSELLNSAPAEAMPASVLNVGS